MNTHQQYLATTYYLDHENASIQSIIREFEILKTDKEKAIGLYLKIRDGWRYNPYHFSFSRENYRASFIAGKTEGHCIDKAILLVACARGLGIPARIHLAKVKNHIGVERIIEKFGTDELTPHGMVNLFIDGQWLKVSPAFNKELCEKCNVATLEFDGKNDSLFQEYDKEGNVFMAYLDDYGYFEEVPFDFIINNFKESYPHIIEKYKGKSEFNI
ncbi:MAG: transglutaminase family protein [Cyclobacteriaceae bacterium]